MAERTIVGVDFGGGKGEGKTWVSEGRLLSNGSLTIDHVQPFLRDDLSEFLQEVPLGTVVALDFPFGVPKKLAPTLSPGAVTMKHVWASVSRMSLEEFEYKCRQIVRHPKREFDEAHYKSESLSPLNLRMVPMTYTGIRMLHKLYMRHPQRWHLPPIDSERIRTDRVTLLEVMPGALLSVIGFSRKVYKGYKNAKKPTESLAFRDKILGNLTARGNLEIPNLGDFQRGCRANDDCLDAVIAAVGAASWALEYPFLEPSGGQLPAAQLEGCIFAPTRKPSA